MREPPEEDLARYNEWLAAVQSQQPQRLSEESLRYTQESRLPRAIYSAKIWLMDRAGDCWGMRYAEDVSELLRHIAALELDLGKSNHDR